MKVTLCACRASDLFNKAGIMFKKDIGKASSMLKKDLEKASNAFGFNRRAD